MKTFLDNLLRNPAVILLAVTLSMDMILGMLRAVKEREFIS